MISKGWKIFLLVLYSLGLGYAFSQTNTTAENSFSVCLIKNATGYPCPSCGSTRGLVALFDFNLWQSLTINPFGVVTFLSASFMAMLILVDVLFNKQLFDRGLNAIHSFFHKEPFRVVIAALLLVANWLWNIYKFQHHIL